MKLPRTLVPALAAALLALAPPALAQDDPHGTPELHEAAGHDASDAEHADPHAVHGDDDHGTHGHHATPLSDPDGDGVPTWRDREHHGEPNEGYVVSDLVFHAFNLLLLLGVLGWFTRKPLSRMLDQRAEKIRAELAESARVREEARQRHEALQARLDAFDQELLAVREEARERAAEDRERLVERARRTAEQIRQTTERDIRDEVHRARDQLRRDAVRLAVELAESTLREQVRTEDQRRLARQFLDSLEQDEVS